MRSVTYADWPNYPITILVPTLHKDEIKKEYLDAYGIPTDDVRLLPLHFTGKKTSVGEMKRFVTEGLLSELEGTQYLVVADAEYFKVLTGEAKAEANLGYVKDCAYGPWKVVYVPSTRTIFYDPIKVRAKIKQGMEALVAHIQGSHADPGKGVIHFEQYPQTDSEIEAWLERLLEMDKDLAIDIEAFSLKHYKAGIGTISFAWNKHEGIAFPVDYVPIDFSCCGGNDERTHHTVDCSKYPEKAVSQAPFGKQVRNENRRRMLRNFFKRYLKKAMYHGISYDVYNLIYQLFMKDLLDTEGLLEGMEIMLRNWNCTMLITYLATNSCAGNELGLKANSQEHSGNYAVEVEDITTIPLDKLLRYNLIDTLSTHFVYEKYWDKMVADQQLDLYETRFKKYILDIIQMQLTGLPLNMKRVGEVKAILQKDWDDSMARVRSTQVVQQFTYRLREKHVAKRNSELKKKHITMNDAEVHKVEFNPNSSPQLQDLLYVMLGLPVVDLTENKQPAVGSDTLKKLLHRTKDPDVKAFLTGMIDYGDVKQLLTTFIPAFEDAVQGLDGWYYLMGSFRLGGTLSGRLSSSNPNLQNIPSTGSKYAKIIKSCFEAPPGWLFCGLDFNSLEDRISALTTKDPNKLKVYIDGYDGHSLRAFAYFKAQMPDIVDTVDSINSIQLKYKPLRQRSKTPTFALTYNGTYKTLMDQGFTEVEAKEIEANYHKFYVVSDKWVQDKLKEAAKTGYVTVAFGLRVRTPLLAQVIRGNSKTPHQAEAEARSAGNALGQSWCLLTNRASAEFMEKVRSGKYRLDIKMCAHIHDAMYIMVRDDMDTILYANKHIRKAAQWQDHPDIWHDKVHLDGALSIFWPNWSHEIELPEEADENALLETVRKKLEKAA
jgi:DNA polymerase-1